MAARELGHPAGEALGWRCVPRRPCTAPPSARPPSPATNGESAVPCQGRPCPGPWEQEGAKNTPELAGEEKGQARGPGGARPQEKAHCARAAADPVATTPTVPEGSGGAGTGTVNKGEGKAGVVFRVSSACAQVCSGDAAVLRCAQVSHVLENNFAQQEDDTETPRHAGRPWLPAWGAGGWGAAGRVRGSGFAELTRGRRGSWPQVQPNLSITPASHAVIGSCCHSADMTVASAFHPQNLVLLLEAKTQLVFPQH